MTPPPDESGGDATEPVTEPEPEIPPEEEPVGTV